MHIKKKAATLVGCVLASMAVHASLVNVDFNSISGGSGTYSGAAILGSVGDTWNVISGNTSDTTARSNLALSESNGAGSAVAISFSGQTGFYDVGGCGFSLGCGIFSGTPYQSLMDDYLYSYGTATVSLSGLTPNGAYRVILYSASNNTSRDTVFNVNGSTRTVVTPDTNFVNGDGYGDFTTMADNIGNLSFTFASGQNGEGDLNGLQIQSIPEPTTFALMGLGLAIMRRKSTRKGR